MNFAKSSTIVLISQITMAITSFVIGLVIARTLGPSGKGAYALLILIPFIMAVFSELGVGPTNIHIFGKNQKELSSIIGNSLVFLAFATIITSGAFFALFMTGILNYKGIDANLLTISIIGFPFVLMSFYFRGLLLANNRVLTYSILGVVDNLLSIILLGLLIFFSDISLRLVVIVSIMGFIVKGLLILIFALKLVNFKPSLDFMIFSETINKGIKLYFANVLQLVNYRLDMFLVGFFVDLANVGYYSVAVGISSLLWHLPDAIGQVLLPRISKIQKHEEATGITAKSLKVSLALLLPVGLLMALLGRYLIVSLYGDMFLPAFIALLILLPGTIIFSIPKVLNADLVGRGHPEVSTFAAIASVIVTIVLDIILIPSFGIVGAALASTLAYTTYAVVMLIYFLRIAGISIKGTSIFRKQLALAQAKFMRRAS